MGAACQRGLRATSSGRRRSTRLQGMGLTNLGSPKTGVQDLVKEPEEVCQIKPETAIETAGVQPAVQQGVVPLHHHESLTLETMHSAKVKRSYHRRRFIMRARQPASNPPPRMVMAKVTPLPDGLYNRSRTPPCTINTERVISEPIPNHQMNVRTSVQSPGTHELAVTVTEGPGAVKNASTRWNRGDAIRDEGRSRRWTRRCSP